MNERLEAFKILKQVIKNNIPLSQLILKNTPSLTKELCFGTTRQYFLLKGSADYLLTKKPDTDVWIIILLGIYQLEYLKTPDYAVVQETVSLLNKIRKTWAKGLVNGTLRNYTRKRNEILSHIKEFYNHPSWLIKKLQKSWPNNWKDILRANDEHPPMTLRVNTQKNTTEEYLRRLQSNSIEAIKLSFSGIKLINPCSVDDLPGFWDGDVSVQDSASQLAVSLLNLEPNQRVLDAASAPGGKLCHILETQPNLAECIAIDLEKKRTTKIQQNLERLQLKAKLITADATLVDTWWDGQEFDRILLDAPCSATGVIRRHPDIKILRTNSDIQTAKLLQQKLLNSLWPLLKSKGILVYATCSILPAENSDQIQTFIEKTKDCKLIQIKSSWGINMDYGIQILPGTNEMDGFFYSVLQKH